MVYFQSNIILNVITEFTSEYRTVIAGTSNDLSSDELSGGARISFVFHEIYAAAIRSMDPFDQVKEVDIRTILYNSSVNYIRLLICRGLNHQSSFVFIDSRVLTLHNFII